jgi:hypothetical protein
MHTADPKGLADYRRELLEHLPEHLADQIVLSAADAAHREAFTPPTPVGVDDDWTADEAQQAIEARRSRRAAELAEVG